MPPVDVLREVIVSPLNIKFTQASISPSLRTSGLKIDEANVQIHTGQLPISSFPHMEVTIHEGPLYSLSNRRLYIHRVLANLGDLQHAVVDVYLFTSDRVQRLKPDINGKMCTKWEPAFASKNGGKSVRVQSRFQHLQYVAGDTSVQKETYRVL